MEARLEQPAPPVLSLGKLLAGIFFTAFGILLTADNLHVLHAEDFLDYWPAFIVAFGLVRLFDPQSNRFLALAVTVAGLWLLAYNLHWVSFTFFDLFWPAVLIVLGMLMIGRAVGVRLPQGLTSDVRSHSSAAILSTRKIVETTRDFRGANAFAFMGGHVLDLTGADITNAPAVIDVFAWWGGIEIFVPDNWEVIGEVTPFMGGFEVKTGPATDPKRRLLVRGGVIMGGVEVTNASRRKS